VKKETEKRVVPGVRLDRKLMSSAGDSWYHKSQVQRFRMRPFKDYPAPERKKKVLILEKVERKNRVLAVHVELGEKQGPPHFGLGVRPKRPALKIRP